MERYLRKLLVGVAVGLLGGLLWSPMAVAHGTVDQSFDGAFSSFVPVSPIPKGQSFTPAVPTLVAVGLRLFGTSECTDTLTVNIRVSSITGPILASTSQVETGCGGYLRHVDFGFVAVTPGASYVIEVSSVASDVFRWERGNGYSGGMFIDETGTPVLNRDAGFRTYFATPPGNQPPNCSNAFPNALTLWPPNGKFHSVTINGVTDADGDTITITIDGITQDEPVSGKGEGNTRPDGQGTGSDTAELRAERSGQSNGRVYEIAYIANDGNGGTCAGKVDVGVPHDQNGAAVNDGAAFDSTVS